MPPAASSMPLFRHPKSSPHTDDGHGKGMLGQHFGAVTNHAVDVRSFAESPMLGSVPDNQELSRKVNACLYMKQSNGETCRSNHYGEKPPPRKRNHGKRRDRAVHDNTFLPSTNQKTVGSDLLEEPLGFTQCVKDVALEGLMAGEQARDVADGSLRMHVTSAGQDMVSSPAHTDSSHQPSSSFTFERSMDSGSTRFMSELELTTHMDGGVDEKEKRPCHYGSDMSSSIARELPLFESLPIVPPAELWSMIQLNTGVPLETLISQAVSLRKDMAILGSNMVSDLSQVFPVNPPQTSRSYDIQPEIFGNCKLNRWIRIGSLLSEPVEARENDLHLRMDVEMTKALQTENVFDIDLNKQPPEAEDEEAEESMAFSTKPEIVDSPSVTGITSQRSSFDAEAFPFTRLMECDYERTDKGRNNVSVADEHMLDKPGFLELTGEPGSHEEHARKQMQESNANTVSVTTNQVDIWKAVQDGPPADNNLHPLSVHVREGDKDEDWIDVPCSPGRQAAADILCEMARSSTLFYNQKSEKLGHLNPSCCTKLTPKTARIVGPIGKGVNKYNIHSVPGDPSFRSSKTTGVLTPCGAKGAEPHCAPTCARNASKPSSSKESSPLCTRTHHGIKKHRSKPSEMHARGSESSRAMMSFSSSKQARGCHQISRKALPHTPSSKSMSLFHES